jgi:hypothetical protein
MSNPFSGQLLNPDDAVQPKPHVDVKPRPVEMVTPYCSQIDAPSSNYVAPSDRRASVTLEVGSRPSASQITAPSGNYQQPDVVAKALAEEPGAKPFYLRLKPDTDSMPADPQGAIYIQSGVFQTDPQQYSGKVLCPVDGSPLTIVGSQHGAWKCAAFGHQWDLVNTAPVGAYIISPTLPLGPAGGDPLGNQNL